MIKFTRCRKCVMPNTKPDLFFDGEGICSACRGHEEKRRIDWEARKIEFSKVLDRYRGKNGDDYDCIIPVSGGKDSTYQTYMMKKVWGMNPLCVSFEPSCPTDIGKRNLQNLVDAFGVDLVQFRKSPIYRTLCRKAFFNLGDHEWPNHVGIFTYPVQEAVRFGIPLLIWGENPQLEYGGPASATQSRCLDRRWLEEFGGLLGCRLDDMVDDKEVTWKDVRPYIYPSDEDIRKVGVTGLFLGYYYFWDPKPQIDIVKSYGWQALPHPKEGTYENFEDIDCDFMPLHQYFKFIKYGFARATDHACYDVRNGRLTREEALRRVFQYDWELPKSKLLDFFSFLGVSEADFFKTVDAFANPFLFETRSDGSFLRRSTGDLIVREFWYDGRLDLVPDGVRPFSPRGQV